MWIEPIYDRTQEDVDNRTSKGYLNIEDLNRIENNVNELASLVGCDVETISWDRSMFPTHNHFNRILANLTTIKKVWVCPCDANPTQPINTYQKVNAIEKILYQIYTNFNIHRVNGLKVNEEYVSRDTNI